MPNHSSLPAEPAAPSSKYFVPGGHGGKEQGVTGIRGRLNSVQEERAGSEAKSHCKQNGFLPAQRPYLH